MYVPAPYQRFREE